MSVTKFSRIYPPTTNYAFPNVPVCLFLQVNLGAVPENPIEIMEHPIAIGAVIDIMDGLTDYVPTVDGKPNKVLCCADGLSIDWMWPSRELRMTGSSPAIRFEGLVEAPPEFHMESVYYQVP